MKKIILLSGLFLTVVIALVSILIINKTSPALATEQDNTIAEEEFRSANITQQKPINTNILPEQLDLSQLRTNSSCELIPTVVTIHFGDIYGNPRIYVYNNQDTNSKPNTEVIDRLKKGELIIDDFRRLNLGMNPIRVRLILGKETKEISTNPLKVEYDLADDISFTLGFKSTANDQILDSAYFTDKSGNVSVFSLTSE